MTALSANRNTLKLAGAKYAFQAEEDILNDEIIYAGGMLAINEDSEIEMASDAAGLRVLGRCSKKIDNADDGEVANAEYGIFRYNNSSSYAVTRLMIGMPCYVEDDNTVGSGSTYLIAAGLVYDVDSSGVWVDQRPEALAIARRLARPKVVSVTDTTVTVTSAQAFQGNTVISCANASGTTVTLPSAAVGYRLGICRANASAGYDVVIQAAAGDTVLSSAVAGTATNDTDAVSQVLNLETETATNWAAANPLAGDYSVWTPSS